MDNFLKTLCVEQALQNIKKNNKSVKAFLMEFARHNQKLFEIVNCMMGKSGLQVFSTDFIYEKNNIFNLLLMNGERIESYSKLYINEEAKNTIQIADPQCSKQSIYAFF